MQGEESRMIRVGDGWLATPRQRYSAENNQESAAKIAPSESRRNKKGPRVPKTWTAMLSPGRGRSESDRM